MPGGGERGKGLTHFRTTHCPRPQRRRKNGKMIQNNQRKRKFGKGKGREHPRMGGKGEGEGLALNVYTTVWKVDPRK